MTKMTSTSGVTATPSDQGHSPHGALSPPIRSAFSLTMGEGVIAFVAATVTWLCLKQPEEALDTHVAPWMAFLPFVLCNAIALSAVCGWRSLRAIETRGLSRLGYDAFAFPAIEMLPFALVTLSGLDKWPYFSNNWITGLLLFGCAGCFIVHFGMSMTACAKGLITPGRRGDIAAAPLFFAWCYLWFVLGSSPNQTP
jgi:hypothetical protein